MSMWRIFTWPSPVHKVGCIDPFESKIAAKMVEREEEMLRQLVTMQIKFDIATTETANSMTNCITALHLEHKLAMLRSQHENDLRMAAKETEHSLAFLEQSDASILALENQKLQHLFDTSLAASVFSLQLASKVAELKHDKIRSEHESNKILATLIEHGRVNSVAMELNLQDQEDRHECQEKAVFTVYQSIIDEQRIKAQEQHALDKEQWEEQLITMKSDFESKLKLAAEEYAFLSQSKQVTENVSLLIC